MPITTLAASVGSNWDSISAGLTANSYIAAAETYFPAGTEPHRQGVNLNLTLSLTLTLTLMQAQ